VPGRRASTVELSLADLRRRYVDEGRPMPEGVEAALRADARAGAQALLEAVARRRRDNRAEGQRLRMMLRYETALWTQGTVHVAGVDEAGMSPLAGPVAAAAVILAPGARLPGVDDSKKLDVRERERLAPIIRETAVSYAVAFADVEEIDRVNIYWAGMMAMRRAVAALGKVPEHVLVDGRKLRGLTLPQQPIVKGDAKSLSIAAASILAKTARDALMAELDDTYPGYGFAQHKGYRAQVHADGLVKLGPCEIHRLGWGPVKLALMGKDPMRAWDDALQDELPL